MPDFILPDEADHCPYCDAVLVAPPNCCDAARKDWHTEHEADLAEMERELWDAAMEFGEGMAEPFPPDEEAERDPR